MFAVYYSNTNKTNIEGKGVAAEEYMYYLKEYNGQIGIFKSSEKEPYQIIDVYIYNLPSLDQQELKSGIMVQDDDKLRMIIEDYES